MRLCSHLYHFANRYGIILFCRLFDKTLLILLQAQAQSSMPHTQPTAEELADMTRRAAEVVRRIEDYRRLYASESERKSENASAIEDHRLPKRPWEDLSQDNRSGPEASSSAPETPDKPQSTAEQDMEIIRIKRATTAAGISTSAGQPKSKYRKRSVSEVSVTFAAQRLILSCRVFGPSSEPHLRVNAILAIFVRLPNGDVGLTAHEHYAMHVDCVSWLGFQSFFRV
jgi:hypothetical protein